MCFVFIASYGSVSKVPADALEAKNRIEPAKKSAKPVAKKNKAPVYRPTEPAPLQQGGHQVKPRFRSEEESESHSHWRMRCNASNERKKKRHLLNRWCKVPY